MASSDDLKVNVFAEAPSVSTLEELKVTFTIENAGTQDLDILKQGNILGDRKQPGRMLNILRIKGEDGKELKHVGLKVKGAVPKVVAQHAKEGDFETIKSKNKVHVTLNDLHRSCQFPDIAEGETKEFAITGWGAMYHLVDIDGEKDALNIAVTYEGCKVKVGTPAGDSRKEDVTS